MSQLPAVSLGIFLRMWTEHHSARSLMTAQKALLQGPASLLVTIRNFQTQKIEVCFDYTGGQKEKTKTWDRNVETKFETSATTNDGQIV
ncbi:hypothetical protein PoB_006232400 [Plakobranchus ocellatus]|uniref:Uncharacterized protein n=1 Tax=Plakobranchus ocellatus TaxID=259542 RepID=A0AAV4CVB2_9GAST|nr:hypothetical protein PoB_006232400 [Plakobranchus ocellatus]